MASAPSVKNKRLTIVVIVLSALWLSVALNIGWSSARSSWASDFEAEVRRCVERPESKGDVEGCLKTSEAAVSGIQQRFMADLPRTLAMGVGPVVLLLLAVAIVRRRSATTAS